MKNTNLLVVYLILIMIFLMSCEAKAVEPKPASNSAKNVSKLVEKNKIELPKEVTKMEPLDVPLINQMDSPRLYNGCEVSSLAMMLNYNGYETTKNELAKKIGRVPLTYENGLKGNPNDGFVGDMENGPGLSVYHGPVADIAREYAGKKAVDLTGEPIETILDNVSQGLPVWIITTANFVPVNDFKTWETHSGIINITYSVHSVVITGYNEKSIYINNPYGQKNQKVNRKNFEQAWKQMGSQAIVIKK
ncbi:C39 family peptidase [Virgibacillus sp. FSP13]